MAGLMIFQYVEGKANGLQEGGNESGETRERRN